MQRQRQQITKAQLLYAQLLTHGVKISFILLVVTFLFYGSGLMTPQVPLTELPQYWHLSAEEYLAQTKLPTGWAWVGLLGTGDVLNFLPIAFLATLTIIGYLCLAVVFLKEKTFLYSAMALVGTLVLTLAATGIVAGH